MKRTLNLAVLFSLLSFGLSSFKKNETIITKKVISFSFKNNSIWPRKFSFISYAPSETGNGTTAYFMAPYGTKTFKAEVGTKYYLASQKQVNTVMSGDKLTGPPFYIVKEEDEGKEILLLK
jgi:hypothetical protein